jgi:hypothetical protein
MRDSFAFRRFARPINRVARRRPLLELLGLEARDVPAGHTVVETIATDFDNNGVDSFLIVTREYDARDHLLQETAEFDADADGTPDALSHSLTQTFDHRGNLTSSVLIQNFDPGVPAVTNVTQAYDSRGRLVETERTVDFDGDGTLDFTDTTTRSYDSRGNLVHQETLFDGDADGTFDSSTVLAQTFNARGNMVESVETQDIGLDGPDSIVRVVQGFNARGDLTTSVRTEDQNADGFIDFTSSRTLNYDTRGHLTLAVTTSGYSGSPSQVETLTQTFNARGDLTTSVDTLDFDGDGVVDIATTVNRTYDARGRLVLQQTTFAGAGSTTLTQAFDTRGNLLSSVESTDLDGDGTADSIVSLTQSFSARGDLVESVQGFDLNGDGTADNVITHTFDYSPD